MRAVSEIHVLMLAVTMFFFSFFLIRPAEMNNRGLIYPGDDDMYFAHVSSVLFGQFPSYEDELCAGKGGNAAPKASFGPSLMASPFVFLFSFVDRIFNAPIVTARTRANIVDSWSLFGFVVATYVYFFGMCLLLYYALRYHFSKNVSFLAVLCMVFFQYFPLYVYRRPVFSHIYEAFLQSSLVFLLLKDLKDGICSRLKWKATCLIGVIVGLVSLVRYNNIPASLLWPCILFYRRSVIMHNRTKARLVALVYLVWALFFLVFKIAPTLYYQQEGYVRDVRKFLLQSYSVTFYLKRIFHVLFWYDWGLVYTSPFLLLGLVALLKTPRRFCVPIMLAMIPLVFNMYGVIMWGSQGGWFGYRYIFFSSVPLLICPFAFLLQDIRRTCGYSVLLVGLLLLAIPSVLSMLLFEGNHSTLSMRCEEQFFGFIDWGNNTYMKGVLQTVGRPSEFVDICVQGGPSFIAYIFGFVPGFGSLHHQELLNAYQRIRISSVIKTFLLYLMPFGLAFIASQWRARMVGVRSRLRVHAKNLLVSGKKFHLWVKCVLLSQNRLSRSTRCNRLRVGTKCRGTKCGD